MLTARTSPTLEPFQDVFLSGESPVQLWDGTEAQASTHRLSGTNTETKHEMPPL